MSTVQNFTTGKQLLYEYACTGLISHTHTHIHTLPNTYGVHLCHMLLGVCFHGGGGGGFSRCVYAADVIFEGELSCCK